MKPPSYDLRRCDRSDVMPLIEKFHPYKSAGKICVYAFAVYESGIPVAGYLWQPPPPGAAKSVCKEAPHGVLALSRMVATPRDQRLLNHVSKPLRRQMKTLIDRTRWPVLVTYSDETLGHTGHVYKCSGWQKRARREFVFYEDSGGRRVSIYSSGRLRSDRGAPSGSGFIQRWEHWACKEGEALQHMLRNGWRQRPTGRKWKSGNPAHEWVRDQQLELL